MFLFKLTVYLKRSGPESEYPVCVSRVIHCFSSQRQPPPTHPPCVERRATKHEIHLCMQCNITRLHGSGGRVEHIHTVQPLVKLWLHPQPDKILPKWLPYYTFTSEWRPLRSISHDFYKPITKLCPILWPTGRCGEHHSRGQVENGKESWKGWCLVKTLWVSFAFLISVNRYHLHS